MPDTRFSMGSRRKTRAFSFPPNTRHLHPTPHCLCDKAFDCGHDQDYEYESGADKRKPRPAKEENGQGKCKEVGLLGQGNPKDFHRMRGSPANALFCCPLIMTPSVGSEFQPILNSFALFCDRRAGVSPQGWYERIRAIPGRCHHVIRELDSLLPGPDCRVRQRIC